MLRAVFEYGISHPQTFTWVWTHFLYGLLESIALEEWKRLLLPRGQVSKPGLHLKSIIVHTVRGKTRLKNTLRTLLSSDWLRRLLLKLDCRVKQGMSHNQPLNPSLRFTIRVSHWRINLSQCKKKNYAGSIRENLRSSASTTEREFVLTALSLGIIETMIFAWKQTFWLRLRSGLSVWWKCSKWWTLWPIIFLCYPQCLWS